MRARIAICDYVHWTFAIVICWHEKRDFKLKWFHWLNGRIRVTWVNSIILLLYQFVSKEHFSVDLSSKFKGYRINSECVVKSFNINRFNFIFGKPIWSFYLVWYKQFQWNRQIRAMKFDARKIQIQIRVRHLGLYVKQFPNVHILSKSVEVSLVSPKNLDEWIHGQW